MQIHIEWLYILLFKTVVWNRSATLGYYSLHSETVNKQYRTVS